MASSNPSWSILPLELVESILYKVPVASLVRLKSTCKQWYALLNDKKFIYKYLELSREGLIRVSDHNMLQFINLETLSLSSIQGPSDIYTVIHCDGLLLCVFITKGIIAVWNPFLSQIKRIKPSSSYTGFDIYGFGYDNASRDNYKILRFKREKGYEEVEIYEFKSQLWRSVDYSLAYSWRPCYNQSTRSMNGNMYWIAERGDDNYSFDSVYDSKNFFIQCFDFSKEVFQETCGFPFIKRDAWLLPRLSGFGGDRFSLLVQHKYGKIQVWVTNNLTDEVVSWSTYFNVTPNNFKILTGYPTYLIHKTNRIMLWCEEEDVENINIYANVYEIGEDFVEKKVETGRRRRCDEVYLYSRCFGLVPSLVPVPK